MLRLLAMRMGFEAEMADFAARRHIEKSILRCRTLKESCLLGHARQ